MAKHSASFSELEQRLAIIPSLRAWQIPTKINNFFFRLKSTAYVIASFSAVSEKYEIFSWGKLEDYL